MVDADPIYVNRVFFTNMISICDENNDIVLVLAIIEKNTQKAEKKSQSKFYILHLLTAIDEDTLNNNKKLTPKKVMLKVRGQIEEKGMCVKTK